MASAKLGSFLFYCANSVGTRLILIVLLALAPLLAFQIFLDGEARKNRARLMEEEVLRILRLVNSEQAQIIEGANQALTLLADIAFAEASAGACDGAVTRLLSQNPRYISMGAIAADGHPVCGSPRGDANANYSDRAFFQKALRADGLVVGQYVKRKSTDEPTVHMARPYAEGGTTQGIVVLGMNLKWWTRQLASIPLPAGGSSSIVDRNGVYLARNPDGAPLTSGSPMPDANRYMLEGKEIGLRYLAGVTGDRRVAAWASPEMTSSGLLVSVGLNVDHTFAGNVAANRLMTWAILLSLGMAAALSFFAGRKLIYAPIRNLTSMANSWRRGEFSARTGIAHTHGEFGQLARAFDDMAAGTQERLMASERLAAIVEQSNEAHFTLTLDGKIETWNNGAQNLLGYEPHEIVGAAGATLIPPERPEELKKIIGSIHHGQPISGFETVRLHKDGRRISVLFSATPLRDARGEIKRVTISLADISTLKERESRIQFLLREVNHRSKNLLSVVLAMVAQSVSGPEQKQLSAQVVERIRALAANQDLLVQNEWKGVELGALVRTQLAHFQALINDRIVLEGPALIVHAAAAQAIGMAIHELATNAAKYGALSQPEGRVFISWKIVDAAGPQPRFHMQWSEQEGPPVRSPTRRGFGQRVIVRMVEHVLDGKVALDYRATGLFWSLDALLSQLQERSDESVIHDS